MEGRVRGAITTPETHVIFLAAWYVTLLSFGIPTLPGWAHLLGALTFGLALLGVAISVARLDRDGVRRTTYRLTVAFVVGVLVSSAVTAATPLTIKSLMKTTFVGKVLVGVVGACLFSGVVVGVTRVLSAVAGR